MREGAIGQETIRRATEWRSARILPLLLAFAGDAQPQAVPPVGAPQDEVVITANKLRKVRLDYTLFGSHLKRCEPVVSSGDPRVDRIVCAMLSGCIAERHREPEPAMACVYRRIDSLAASMPPPPEWEEEAPRLPAPSTSPVAELEQEVVITGRRPAIAPGLWTFTATQMSLGSGHGRVPAARRWRLCVRDADLLPTVQRLVGDDPRRKRRPPCGWRLRFTGVRIAGEQQCMQPGTRVTGRIEGEFDAESVVLNGRTRAMRLHSGISLDSMALGPSPADFESWFQLTGSRAGDCKR